MKNVYLLYQQKFMRISVKAEENVWEITEHKREMYK